MIVATIFDDGVCVEDGRWIDTNIWGAIKGLGICRDAQSEYWQIIVHDENGKTIASVYADAIKKGD